jgi:hypothetical protein
MLPANCSVHVFRLGVEMTSFRAPFVPVMLNGAHANDGLGVDPGQCQWQHLSCWHSYCVSTASCMKCLSFSASLCVYTWSITTVCPLVQTGTHHPPQLQASVSHLGGRTRLWRRCGGSQFGRLKKKPSTLATRCLTIMSLATCYIAIHFQTNPTLLIVSICRSRIILDGCYR